jgi:hypothetical protein
MPAESHPLRGAGDTAATCERRLKTEDAAIDIAATNYSLSAQESLAFGSLALREAVS